MTDCCILNSAFDASNLGYRVTVAQDLVRGTNVEMEDAALKMVSLHIGLVAESCDLIAEWRRQIDATCLSCGEGSDRLYGLRKTAKTRLLTGAPPVTPA